MKSYGVTVQLRATEHIFVRYLLLWVTLWSLLFGQYCCYLFDFISYMYYFSLIIFLLFKDHNYGQPPPMTPPDSNSPGPEDGDTGNEDEEDDGVTRCIW